MLMVLALPVFASSASALTTANPPAFQFVNDENGADDQPGQKDLSAQAIATPAPGDLWVSWKWDDTKLSGGNTGDACALFDTNTNSKVNFAICVTIAGNPATQAPQSPRVYTCGDGKVDRCTSTITPVTPISSACSTNTTAGDPFHAGQTDTQAICHIDLADVGGAGRANLVNTCSYPSQQPTSDPSDCVLIPRDAFVVIQKNASPNTGSFPFRLGPAATATTNPVVFTAAGTQTSTPVAIVSGVAQSLKEDVPANWAVSGTPSCTGATGAGTSNGTGTAGGDTIANIKAASDNVITCTYNDVQQTGAIRITKQRSGTSVVLSGAHFSVDGTGDYTTGADGTVCVAGLTIGSHQVTETQAPHGHNLASPASQAVTVSNAATCSTAAPATATFNDPLVLGTINIEKVDGGGAPLGGATFTLYVNNAPTAGPRGGEDTVTTLTCSTTVVSAGKCAITNVPLGNYWVVESTTPAGYHTAADTAVTIGVGTSPGQGDTESLKITDVLEKGTINVHKTGLNGTDLAGATFTLWVDNFPLGKGLEDSATSKTCGPTDNAGACSITGVDPGDYLLVETTTPPGYATVDPVKVTVPAGTQANQGSDVLVPISDPVVTGTVHIHKTGLNGAALAGAEFTLYTNVAPLAGPRDNTNPDPITSPVKKCTTDAAGDCDITGVAPDHYWVVETVTPAGYDTAAEQSVNVSVGTQPGVGDTESLTFADPVVPGTVRITKSDDAGHALAGAEFTLYTNVAPLAGPRDNTNPDPITSPAKSCTTDGTGTCDITGVDPGAYWVVETGVPAHYDKADDTAVVVGLGSAAHQGDTVPVSLVDPRRHRVVVLVCHEGTDTLLSRDVTVGGVTKQSLGAGSLTDAQQKALCDTGGASFGDISGHPDVNALVALGKLNGAATP